MQHNVHWKSRFFFVLALIGSAVGLGNIWRFPYLAKQEGIFFILFYLLFVFVIGVPAIFIEIYAGTHHKHSLLRIAKEYLKRKYYLVAFSFIVVLAVASYYTVVTGWTLAFAFLPSLSFYTFKQSFLPFLFALFVNLTALIIVNKDFHHGIEAVNKYFVTFLFFFIFVLFVFSMPWAHLPQIYSQIPAKFNLSIVLSALSQALFSLSLGVGLLYTYALFAKPNHLFTTSFLTAAADTVIALLSFFLIMSFFVTSNVEFSNPEEFSFVVLKNVFSSYKDFGVFISFIFFLFLFSAAYTSVISFYSFLKFNLPKRLWWVLYLPLIFSSVIALDWMLGYDAIYILDRYIVEPLLPISMFINLVVFLRFYHSKIKEHRLPSSKLPMRNSL